MGYCLNRLDEPVFIAGPKPMRTEFSIHHRLESCVFLAVDKIKRDFWALGARLPPDGN